MMVVHSPDPSGKSLCLYVSAPPVCVYVCAPIGVGGGGTRVSIGYTVTRDLYPRSRDVPVYPSPSTGPLGLRERRRRREVTVGPLPGPWWVGGEYGSTLESGRDTETRPGARRGGR